MRRKVNKDADAKSPFLLPFGEVPRCSVKGKGRSRMNSIVADDSTVAEDPENQERKECFDEITLERTSDELMPDGPMEENHSGKFLIKVGQTLLLRPEENSLRPGVGKLISIFREKGKEGLRIRLKWYYRAEDLTDGPSEAVGEDEIFETQHYDNVDADSISGRCQVLAYKDWIVLADAKRRSTLALKTKYAETLRKDNISSQARTGPGENREDGKANESTDALKEKFMEAVKADKILIEDQAEFVDGNGDPMDVDDTDGSKSLKDAVDDQSDSQDAPNKLESGNIHNLPSMTDAGSAGLGPENEDIISTFHANYPDSSLLYYCRRFYDPLSNAFLVSKHEDDDADPVEEMIALRAGREQSKKNADKEFFDQDEDTSSDEDYEMTISADELEGKDSRRKRRRGSRGNKPARKRERAPGVSQFSLPQDLGIPTTLPCRDSQKAHVQRFLLGAIQDSASGGQGGSRCLYISGVPGTGKTATVREVLRDLIAKRSSGDLPPFEVVEVNAMSLPDPNLVYSELYHALTGSRNVTPMHAAQLLEKRFSTETGSISRKPKRAKGGPGIGGQPSCTILILDEMDVLLARKQKVLYDMLEWPTRKDARMAVIGIANTMDLPERILPRIGSRLGLNRLSYPPYTSSQLQTILEMTLDETRVEFSKTAIQLCVKKVGSVSGDVRRALELCRRSCEILLDTQEESGGKEGEKPVVTANHMQTAVQDIAGGARLVALNQLSTYEKVVLGSAISLARREGSSAVEKTCSLAAVISEAIHLTRRKQLVDKENIPSIQDLEEACWRLAVCRIVIVETAAVPRNSRIIVNVSTEDCLFALRECKVMAALLESSDGS